MSKAEDVIQKTLKQSKTWLEGFNTFQTILLIYIARELGINLFAVLGFSLLVQFFYKKIINFYLKQSVINMRSNSLLKDKAWVQEKADQLDKQL